VTPVGPRLGDAADEDLHAAALGGDRAAMETLLARHQPLIFTVCRRMLGRDADAADATQDTLIKVVTHLDRFDGRARFSTWVYRIASNTCLDELRRRQRRPATGLPGVDLDGPEPGEVPKASAALVEDRADVDAALAAIPEDFRIPVILRDLCDMDYAAIAEALDLPMGTVRSRISRGRAALAPLLGNRSPRPERRSSTDRSAASGRPAPDPAVTDRQAASHLERQP